MVAMGSLVEIVPESQTSVATGGPDEKKWRWARRES